MRFWRPPNTLGLSFLTLMGTDLFFRDEKTRRKEGRMGKKEKKKQSRNMMAKRCTNKYN